MDTQYFTIHDTLSFCIHRVGTAGNALLLARLLGEYEAFRCTEKIPDTIDFELFLYDRYTPDLTGYILLEDGEYAVKKECLFRRERYKWARWSVHYTGLEHGPVKVHVCGNAPSWLFFGGYVVDSLIRYCGLKKGLLFLHAAGLAKNNRAIIFPARSGTGKTVLTNALIEKGYRVLGDNFVIVTPAGDVCSFHSRMNLFFYNVSSRMQKMLTYKERLGLLMTRLVYHLTGGYIKLFTPVSTRRLFPDDLQEQAVLEQVVYLVKKNGVTTHSREDGDVSAAMVRNNQLEEFPFCLYLEEYAAVYPDSFPGRYWEHFSSLLDAALHSLPSSHVRMLSVPAGAGSNQLAECVEDIAL